MVLPLRYKKLVLWYKLVMKYKLVMRGGEVLPHSSGGWTEVWLLGTLLEEGEEEEEKEKKVEEEEEEEEEEETEKHKSEKELKTSFTICQ